MIFLYVYFIINILTTIYFICKCYERQESFTTVIVGFFIVMILGVFMLIYNILETLWNNIT